MNDIEVTPDMLEAGKPHALRFDFHGGMSDAQIEEVLRDLYRAMRADEPPEEDEYHDHGWTCGRCGEFHRDEDYEKAYAEAYT